MFEKRLKTFLILWTGVLVIVAARLGQLQLLQGASYAERSQRLLRTRPEPLPFVRGPILDRTGLPLASDEPCWQIQVDYRVIALKPDDVSAHVRRYHLKDRYADDPAVRNAAVT